MSTQKFHTDSIAARVIAFLTANPTEELGLEEITAKFDAVRGNIHTLLARALEHGYLKRDRNKDGEWIYTAGPAIQAKPDGVDMDVVHATHADKPTKAGKPRKGAPDGFNSPRHAIDFDALKVDEGVPMPPAIHAGKNKWQPLFDKLTKPGQSIALPGHMRGAVAAAALKVNRLKKQGTFRVALVSKDTARIYRTA